MFARGPGKMKGKEESKGLTHPQIKIIDNYKIKSLVLQGQAEIQKGEKRVGPN